MPAIRLLPRCRRAGLVALALLALGLAAPASADAIIEGEFFRDDAAPPHGLEADLFNAYPDEAPAFVDIVLFLKRPEYEIVRRDGPVGGSSDEVFLEGEAPGRCFVVGGLRIFCSFGEGGWFPGEEITIWGFDVRHRDTGEPYPDGAEGLVGGCLDPGCDTEDDVQGPFTVFGPGADGTGGDPGNGDPGGNDDPGGTPDGGGDGASADLRAFLALGGPQRGFRRFLSPAGFDVVLEGFVGAQNHGPDPAADASGLVVPVSLPPGGALLGGHVFVVAGCLPGETEFGVLCGFGPLGVQQTSRIEDGLLQVGFSRSGRIHLGATVGSSTQDPDSSNNSTQLIVDVRLIDSRLGRHTLGARRPAITVFTTGGDGQIQAAGHSEATSAQDASGPRVQIAIARLKGKAKVGAAGVGSASAAQRRRAGSCQWVRNKRAKRRTERAQGGRCDEPTWLNAKKVKNPKRKGAGRKRGGKRKGKRGGAAAVGQAWRLQLRKALPCGRYVVLSRGLGASGAFEARFTPKDGNLRTTRIKRPKC